MRIIVDRSSQARVTPQAHIALSNNPLHQTLQTRLLISPHMMQMPMCQPRMCAVSVARYPHMVSVADVKYPYDSSNLTETKTGTSPQGDSRPMDIASVARCLLCMLTVHAVTVAYARRGDFTLSRS
jgi:predicted molibdopterin-dependent oxidoreductase YjgC